MDSPNSVFLHLNLALTKSVVEFGRGRTDYVPPHYEMAAHELCWNYSRIGKEDEAMRVYNERFLPAAYLLNNNEKIIFLIKTMTKYQIKKNVKGWTSTQGAINIMTTLE